MANKRDLGVPLLDAGTSNQNGGSKEKILMSPISPTPRGTDKTYDYLFKLLLVGDAGVGKSCILTRYVDNQWEPTYIQTIGVDFKIRTIIIEDTTIKLQIWDTTGQQRFRTITSSYYKGSHIFLIIFDVTDHDSFNNVQQHLNEVAQYANQQQLFCKMIIGNKMDLEKDRVVTLDQAQQIANYYGIQYMECSAKTGFNVDSMFKYAAKHAAQKKRESDKMKSLELSETASMAPSVSQKPSRCCCTVL